MIIIKKIDKTVLKETAFIGVWMLIFSGIMQAIFLVIGKWDYTVLLGNLLSGIAGVLNFLLLGVTVQKAVNSGDEKYAKTLMKASQAIRLIMIFGVAVLGATIPQFNLWATLIPLLFPRITIVIRQILINRKGGGISEQ